MIVNKRFFYPLLYKKNKRNNTQVWHGLVENNQLKIIIYEISFFRQRIRKFNLILENYEKACNVLLKRYNKKIKEGYNTWNRYDHKYLIIDKNGEIND